MINHKQILNDFFIWKKQMKTLLTLIIFIPLTVMANVDLKVVLISNQNNDGSTGTMVLEMQAKSDAGDINIGQFRATFLDDNVLNALNPVGIFSEQLFTDPDYPSGNEILNSGPHALQIDVSYVISKSGTPTPAIISGSAWTKIYTLSITYDLSAGQTTSFSWSSQSNDFVIQQYSPYADITINLGDLPSNVSVSPSPLPVELTTFTARILNQKVSLNWQTATEVNNYGFEVERQMTNDLMTNDNNNHSSLVNSHWTKIGFVKGNGNSNSPKFYSFTDETLQTSGKYLYKLKQIDNDGNFEYSKITEVNFNMPISNSLDQNYPNPFNPSTTIKYTLSQSGFVSLKVYDIIGKEVKTLVNREELPGTYKVQFNGSELTSGVYFYRIKAGEFVSTKKFTLLK